MENVQFHLVETLDDANDLARWLGQRRDALAVDTETSGLSFWSDDLRLVQLGDTETGWAVPWERWGGLVVDLLKKYEDPFVLHHAKFDLHFLEPRGVQIPRHRIDDTMLAAHVLDSERSVALKRLSSTLIHPAAAAGQKTLDDEMRKNGWTWGTVPVDFPPYWVYAALDVVLTARLWEQFKDRIHQQHAAIYELELACQWVLLDMETRGARIDTDYCEMKLLELEDFVRRTEEEVQRVYGITNLSSNDQVARALISDGCKWSKTTKTGRPSLDEEVLVSLQHPLANAVLSARRQKKIAHTYFAGFLARHHDGLLHPSINQLGAKTGRMSVSDPPLQTLPRGDVVRDAFIAGPENRLLLCDYLQMELRVFAAYAQEEAMLAAIRNGTDLHDFVTRLIFHLEESVEVKGTHQRDVTKNANFAKVYGAGTWKFSKTAGITEDEAKAFMARYEEMFPGVRRFQDRIQDELEGRLRSEGRAYVQTILGRRVFVEADMLYKGINYLIQSGCANILKRALVELDNAGVGPYLVLPIHDEVLLEVPEQELEEVEQTVRQVMTVDDLFTVPLDVSTKIVERWGNAYA